MGRITVFLLGTITAWVAWNLFSQMPAPARKRVRVNDAAEQLRRAWADHHTS